MSQAPASPATLSSAPPMGVKLGAQLSIMMFLQYAIWGAWLPILWPFLYDYREFTPEQIGTMFAVGAIGALLAPFIAGQIADRYFNTEKFLGISHIIGAILIWQLSSVATMVGFLVFSLFYSIIFSPTLSLTNSLAFHHVPDRDRDFGRVRVWGTVGWIAAGIAVGQWLSHQHTIDEAEATNRLVQRHIIDPAGREQFTKKVEVTLRDAAPATVVEVGPGEGPTQQVRITLGDKSPLAGTTLRGTIYEQTSDVLVLDVSKKAEAVDLRAVRLVDVSSQRPMMEALVRPERLDEVKAAVAAGNGENLLKYSQYSVVTTRGGAAETGDNVIVTLASGESVTGVLLVQTEKVVVLESDAQLTAYPPSTLADIQEAAGDPIIGNVAQEQPDPDLLTVVTMDGQPQSVRKKNVVSVAPYSVFNADVVAKTMNDVQAAGRADAFRLSGILGIIMGVFCFMLPRTPPSPGRQTSATAEAWGEVKRQPLLTLFLLAVPISCIHQFYFVHTSSFVSAYQNKAEGFMDVMNAVFGKGGGGFMTIGQISELAVLAFIPLVAKRWSRKTLLTLGIIAYALRMFLFAYVDVLPLPPVLTIVLGVALHGFCFGCFIFVAFMIVDEETTGDVRASAQSLFNLVIVGIGIIVGSLIAGWVATAASASGKMDYRQLFSVPMWGAVGCLAFLLAFYPGGRRVPRHPD